MNTSNVDPNQVSRSLHESITRNASLSQFRHRRPPRAVKIIHVVLGAKVLQGPPVVIRYSEPFWVSRSDVNVDCTKIVVFLVTRRSGTRNFHVELDRVHAQDLVANVRQHVSGGNDSGPCRKFVQFVQLWWPFFLITDVAISAKLEHFSFCLTSEVVLWISCFLSLQFWKNKGK